MPDEPEMCCAAGACCDEAKSIAAFGRLLARWAGQLSIPLSEADAQRFAVKIRAHVDTPYAGTTYEFAQRYFKAGQQHPHIEP